MTTIDFPCIERIKKIQNVSQIKILIREALRAFFILKEHLEKNPAAVDQFQASVNKWLDQLSSYIVVFEQQNDEKSIYRWKRLFAKKLRRFFLNGFYINQCYSKPFGYAGDFQIIDAIYLNKPASVGHERLWDNYFLRMGPSIATRNRKEDFKQIILEAIKNKKKPVRIMDLASGPARDLKELFDMNPVETKDVLVDCYDFDPHAIDFARKLLADNPRVDFFQRNALRMAVKKNIREDVPHEYDFIFSTGLFDYLDARVSMRLISNLKKVLKPNGVMCISNYREKKYNPWAGLMEWVVEWNLIYKTEDEFADHFLGGGFTRSQLELRYEPLKIMQYILAYNS